MEHVGRIEPVRSAVRVVRVPRRHAVGGAGGEALLLQRRREVGPQLPVAMHALQFLGTRDGVEVPLPVVGQPGFEVHDRPVLAQHPRAVPDRLEGVGGEESRLQVRERPDAVVLAPLPGRVLLDRQGDEHAQLGDLAGDGLEVHPEQRVLDQEEFSTVVRVAVLLEDGADFHQLGVPGGLAGFVEGRSGPGGGPLLLQPLPPGVVGVEPAERQGQFVQDAHREGAGTDGGVEDREVGDGGDQGLPLARLEEVVGVVAGVLVVEQVVESLDPPPPLVLVRRGLPGEGLRQGLLHHVIHHDPGRVVTAGLFPGGGAALRVVGGEQVLEDLAEQFGIQGDFLFRGRAFLDGEAVAVEHAEQPGGGRVPGEEEPVGYGVGAAVVGIVGETVHAAPASGAAGEVVEAVEQSPVHERRPVEESQQAVRIGDLFAISVHGEVAVIPLSPSAEPALGDLGVQGGEEQVLQHGAVVGVAGLEVAFAEKIPGPRFGEQLFRDQSLLLHEPHEHEPGHQPDHMLFRAQDPRPVRREGGLRHRPLEPVEQVPVEPAVQFFGVERVQPGPQQPVEVDGLPVRPHPYEAPGERERRHDVQVGAVRLRRMHLADQEDPAQDITRLLPPVPAPVDEREGHESRRRPEQHDDGHGEPPVDLPGEFGVSAARGALTEEFHGHEEETPGESALEDRSIFTEPGISLPVNLVVRQLEEDFDGADPIEEGGFLRSLRLAFGRKSAEEGVRRGIEGRRAAVAPIAEFRQQRDGGLGEVACCGSRERPANRVSLRRGHPDGSRVTSSIIR